VIAALDLLRAWVPANYLHVLREIETVVLAPGWCGPDAIACTGSHHGRRAVLQIDPLAMDLIELAVTLDHEARHHFTDDSGRHYVIEHVCTDCSDPRQRAEDPIYVEDERVRRVIWAALRPVPASDPIGDFAKGAAVAALGTCAVLGAVELLGALLKPRRRYSRRYA
jgi:hypothetical protein